MKNSKLYPAFVLGSICLVVALLLSGINHFTAPIIAQRENDSAFDALKVVLPDGSNFRSISLDGMPEGVTEAYSADGGFVFRTKGNGRNGDIVLMVGIDAEGRIVGTQTISESESKGYKEPVFAALDGINTAYKGQTYETFEAVIVAGGTMTSNGYSQAIKAALQAFEIANGAVVDTRTPEQILQDNCNAALGTENIKFNKWFAVEAFQGVDAIYEAEDNSGRVYVIGESFIGVKNGAVVNADADGAGKTLALAADATISAITFDDVEKPEGTKATVKSIQKASNGTYVFTLSANGYQAMFDWGDGTPVEILLSISADGKIIDVRTTAHRESAGYGDACATEDYYEQYRGKGDGDITISSAYPDHHGTDLIPSTSTDVGVIASATYTTVGYQNAVKDAFVAFQLIIAQEGGNE